MLYLCIRKAAPQHFESAIKAPQGASITTKKGHNRRPAPVVYYDPKGSSLGEDFTSH